MRRANPLENTLMLGKIEDKRRREWQRMRWLDSITNSMDMNLTKLWEIWRTGKPGVLQSLGFQRVWQDLLCLMSESPSGKREGLQDNATGKKGKFITDSSQGPLPHPMQWCRSESPEPKLLHKFIRWAHTVGLSGLATSLQSNFIGQNFCMAGTFLGVSVPFLIS